MFDPGMEYEPIAVAKEAIDERAQLILLSDKNKPTYTDVKWDLNPDRFYLSLDGYSDEEFYKHYGRPDVVYIDTIKFNNTMHPSIQRNGDPFFFGDPKKMAELIAYLEYGGRVTPPFLLYNNDQVVIGGGNHRFTLAFSCNQIRIPVLIERENMDVIIERIANVIVE